MKAFLMPLALALLAGPVAAAAGEISPATSPLPPGFRYHDVEQAWQMTQTSKRPLLLFISGQQCHFCVKMLQQTYAHPQIAAAVSSGFEPVIIQAEDHPDLMKKLAIRSLPTTLVVSYDAKLLARMEGFLEPEKFAVQIAPIVAQEPLPPTAVARQ